MKTPAPTRFNRLVLALIAATLGGIPTPSAAVQDQAGRAPQMTLKLAPPKAARTRPLIAIIADNIGTETTDFVIPYGVLKESGVADVITVSTAPGEVRLMPALRVQTDVTAAQFDAATPVGADVVVVPAMHRPDDPVLTQWVRSQADKGALVVSICEGAWVLAHAGLLDGKSATTHWYALDKIAKEFPGTTWVRDRRYVIDGQIMTTTGVTASIPASLALVEAIAGRRAAETTARRLGVASWSDEHETAAYSLPLGLKVLAASNWLARWRHEVIDIPVAAGSDEIALALTADAWSRTYRSHAVAINADGQVRSLHGLLLDTDVKSVPTGHDVVVDAAAPTRAVDTALTAIADRYGQATSQFVATQLEYSRRARP